ncbi:hypothetical protein ACNFCK_13335 [Pseudomonas sp. NY15366]
MCVLPVALGQLPVVLNEVDFVAVEAAGHLWSTLPSHDVQDVNAKRRGVREYQRTDIPGPTLVASKRALCHAHLGGENILI